jgi:hypothetical protein
MPAGFSARHRAQSITTSGAPRLALADEGVNQSGLNARGQVKPYPAELTALAGGVRGGAARRFDERKLVDGWCKLAETGPPSPLSRPPSAICLACPSHERVGHD